MFLESWYGVCRVNVQCTVIMRCLYGDYTVLYSEYTVLVERLHCLLNDCTVFVQPLYCVCTVIVQCFNCELTMGLPTLLAMIGHRRSTLG